MLEKEFQVEPKLIPGSGGVYDITVNGELIYSKHQSGWFPENDEILEILRKSNT